MKTEVLKEFEGKFVWVHYDGFDKAIGGVLALVDDDFCLFKGMRGEFAKRQTLIATNKIISIDYNQKDDVTGEEDGKRVYQQSGNRRVVNV